MARNDVRVRITAEDATSRAFASMHRRLQSMRSAANTVGKAVAGTGIAAAGTIAVLTQRSMESIDALAKTADKIGITTEALAGLQHAGEITGVSTNTMNMALQRMTRRVAEAARGTGEAKGALQELGIDAAKLAQLPLDEQMKVVAEQMGQVTNQSDRVRLAMKLFDSQGVALVNTLALGADGLDQMAREAQTLGIAINRVDAAQIEAANDNIDRAKKAMEGFTNQIAVAASPVVAELAANFYQTALDANEAGNVGDRVMGALVTGAGHAANAIRGIQIAFHLVRGAVATVGAGITDLFSEIGSGLDWFIGKYNEIAAFLGRDQIDVSLGKIWGNVSASLQKVADDAFATAEALALMPLPSDDIKKWYDSVKAKARETAKVVAANAPVPQIGDSPEVDPVTVPKIADQFSAEYDKAIELSNTFTSTITKTFDAMGMTLTESQQKTLNAYATIGAMTMQQMSVLANAFGEGAAASKAFFVIQQGLAAANAIINGYQAGSAIRVAFAKLAATTGNAGYIAIGESAEKASIAMGFATAGAIAGQTIGSFEGGGYTGTGARAGGLDGRGGMLAMVHPNESIIDHNQGQGAQPISVNINVTAADTRDFDRLLTERRGMITSMVSRALANRGQRLGAA